MNLKGNRKAYSTHHWQHLSRSMTVTFARGHSLMLHHKRSLKKKEKNHRLEENTTNILIFLPNATSHIT